MRIITHAVIVLHLLHPVALLAEQAPHIQRLCPRCSGHGFSSACGPLLHVIPSLSPLFPVHSSALFKKPPKNIFRNKTMQLGDKHSRVYCSNAALL